MRISFPCKPLTSVIVLWLVHVSTVICAQGYKFEYLSVGDGLSQVSVNCILQDSRGFMWFGTDDGLNKYDGYQFTTFHHLPDDSSSLPHNQIHDLLEDNQRRLWVATTGGLAVIDLQNQVVTRWPQAGKQPKRESRYDVRTLLIDRFGDLWMGTRINGILRTALPPKGDLPDQLFFENFRRIPDNPQSFCSDKIARLLQTSDGDLWAATEDGLSRLRRRERNDFQFTTYRHQPGDASSLVDNDVETLYEDRNGIVWIGTTGGLSRYVEGEDAFQNYLTVTREAGQIDNIVWSIFEDRDKQFWIGTVNGLVLFDRETARTRFFRYDPVNRRSISNSVIQDIREDRSGVLWIGTAGGGVNKLNSHRAQFRHYLDGPRDDGNLVSRIVTAVHEDRQGMVWAGTLEYGLFGLNFKQGQATDPYREPDIINYQHQSRNALSLSHNNVLSIASAEDGGLWVGTWGGGLNYLDRESGEFFNFVHDPEDPASLRDPENEVRALLVDSRERLWVGTDAGLHLMTGSIHNPAFWSYRHDPLDSLSLPGDNILAIFEDSEADGKRLWISTLAGFCGADLDDSLNMTVTRYDNQEADPAGFSGNVVLNIYEDSTRNALWLGTFGGGLVRFDYKSLQFTRFSSRYGLPNDIVYGVTGGRGPFLWISTNRGLARFNPDDPARTVFHYNLSDGLQSDIFSANAVHRRRNGQILFGGINGLNAFFPEEVTVNRYAPPVVITNFREFDKIIRVDISEPETLELSQNENFFSFEFSALDFTNPSKNRYAYKLEGFDKTWRFRTADNRQASYTNLDGGQYTFRVRASNNDGVWNEQGLALKVLILPPLWARPWFQGMLVLLAIFSAMALLKLRIRRAEMQAIRLEMVVRERTAELNARQMELQKQTRELESANHQLQQEVLERRKAEQLAEQANRAKSEFLTNMNHELRTPLNGILGYSEIIRKQANLQPKQVEAIRIIKQCAKHLLRLINDLLDFSRIEAGKLEIHARPFRFSQFLSSLSAMMRLKAQEENVVFLEEFDEELPEAVVGDEKRIHQILLNLLNNAVKFTALKKEENDSRQVVFSVRRLKPGQFRFSVRDTGIGIADEHLQEIFEPFHQVAPERHFVEGTGLGLGICRELTKLLGGELQVSSELGKGSSFWFDLQMPEEQISGNRKGPRKPVAALANGDSNAQAVLPQSADVELLRKAIRIGDISEVLVLLDKIVAQDERLKPFAESLGKLARGFEVERLQKRFEQLMSDDTQVKS